MSEIDRSALKMVAFRAMGGGTIPETGANDKKGDAAPDVCRVSKSNIRYDSVMFPRSSPERGPKQHMGGKVYQHRTSEHHETKTDERLQTPLGVPAHATHPVHIQFGVDEPIGQGQDDPGKDRLPDQRLPCIAEPADHSPHPACQTNRPHPVC